MDKSDHSNKEQLLTIETHKKLKLKESVSTMKDMYIVNINKSNKIKFSKNSEMLSNQISTSKYNWYNCVPKILYEQFSKINNIYFLFLAILQVYSIY